MNLTTTDLEMFQKLGIDQKLLAKAGVERVDDATPAAIAGWLVLVICRASAFHTFRLVAIARS
jgi:hypothetical protein